MTRLKALDFSLIEVTDINVEVFSTLTGFKSLGLDDCFSITMVGLRWISVVTRLANQSLSRCVAIAKSFDGHYLENLTQLTKLVLAGNN